MIKLSTVLRGLSIDIRSYAIAQPVDLVHFLALATIFHDKAAEVEALEVYPGTPGLDMDVGVFHLLDRLGVRLVKAADANGRVST